MGRYLWVIGVVVMCVLFQGVPVAGAPEASTGPAAGVDTGQEADHAALRALVPVYEQAANEGKPAFLEPLLDPEFTGVMVTGDEVKGSAGLKDYWSQMQKVLGSGGKYHGKVNVAGPAIIAVDMAVASCTSDEDVVSSGKEMHYVGEWSAAFRKRDGQCKVLRVHAST